MARGQVYVWQADPRLPGGGAVRLEERELRNLDPAMGGLRGRFVRVLNGAFMNVPDASGCPRPTGVGAARPDTNGDFQFEPGLGLPRIDKVELARAGRRRRFRQAAHFGEVNTYFHLNQIAEYIDALLRALGGAPLPAVTAVACAHNAAVERGGERDGVRRDLRRVPFEGGHYRLPARSYDVPEWRALDPNGEIHLGPGRRRLREGALVERAGAPYRNSASHNASIIYHEYGHHITRHTADPLGNRQRLPRRQCNRKTALDEGTSDYWAATLLDTPHIRHWNRSDTAATPHPRSLVSPRTMASFDPRATADPHANGTIWAAALWEVREQLRRADSGGSATADMLVLRALLLLGAGGEPGDPLRRAATGASGFAAGVAALVAAAELQGATRHAADILRVFARRGIRPPRDGSAAPTSVAERGGCS